MIWNWCTYKSFFFPFQIFTGLVVRSARHLSKRSDFQIKIKALNGIWLGCSRLTFSCVHVMSEWKLFTVRRSGYTRIDGFYFFFRVFLRPPVPVRLRFTVFGDLSLAVPLTVGPLPLPFGPSPPVGAFFTNSFDLLCRCSMPSFPFARRCCWTNSLKAPSCASIVRNVVMNSS